MRKRLCLVPHELCTVLLTLPVFTNVLISVTVAHALIETSVFAFRFDLSVHSDKERERERLTDCVYKVCYSCESDL